MRGALLALLGYAGWAILLALAIVSARSLDVVLGRKRANEFPGGVPHGGDRYWRLNRAHVNVVENLPIFGAIVLVGAIANAGPRLDQLAFLVLGARIVQSSIHVASGTALAVIFRVSAFLTQLGALIAMVAVIAG